MNNFTNDFPPFNSMFIHEFSPGKDIKLDKSTIVYHYTSPNAFLSILQGNAVRFSDIRYMNDKSESVFFVKRLIEFCEENAKTYPFFTEAVNALLKGNDYAKIKSLEISKVLYSDFPGLKMEKQRNFIFCTCNDADSLNMWNYYASNGTYSGYNIGFSVQKFLKAFDVDELAVADAFIVYYGNVLYKKKLQFEAIQELANNIERFLTFNNNFQNVFRAAIIVRNYIQLKGPFFKDDSFKSENEFRFLFSIAESRIPHNKSEAEKYRGKYNKSLCEDFTVKNGLIVPFMCVSIPDNSISRITISPMTEFEIAKESIKEVLSVSKMKSTADKEIPVYKSTIPIRF